MRTTSNEIREAKDGERSQKTNVKKPSDEIRATSNGFTLIEMIGVLAIIAILVALLLPKVFDVMVDSKARALVAAVKTYETAIVDYYADIGSILPLDAGGTPAIDADGDSANLLSLPARLTLDKSDALNTGSNSWMKFKGPYLANFLTEVPPGFGPSITMRAQNALAYGTATGGTNRAYDFDDDGNSDLPTDADTDADLVCVHLTDVERQDFERVDSILDPGLGMTFDVRRRRGKVKYSDTNKALRIYLAHR